MSKNNTIEKLPGTWEQLLAQFYSLRPIHNETDYDKAMDAAGFLAAHEKLTTTQQDYLETLSMILSVYEDQQEEIDTSGIGPIEVLETLLKVNDMNPSDLGRLLGDRSLGSRILSGERELSKKHIAILSDHFAVKPGLFLPSLKQLQAIAG
jgi:HTH-type transcriptional regulator/antitoxin HigA